MRHQWFHCETNMCEGLISQLEPLSEQTSHLSDSMTEMQTTFSSAFAENTNSYADTLFISFLKEIIMEFKHFKLQSWLFSRQREYIKLHQKWTHRNIINSIMGKGKGHIAILIALLPFPPKTNDKIHSIMDFIIISALIEREVRGKEKKKNLPNIASFMECKDFGKR